MSSKNDIDVSKLVSDFSNKVDMFVKKNNLDKKYNLNFSYGKMF